MKYFLVILAFIEAFALPSKSGREEIDKYSQDVTQLLRNELKKVDLQKTISAIEDQQSEEVFQQIANIFGDKKVISKIEDNSSCACIGYNCGCCLHLEWDVINLNDTVCVNFSYLPAPEYGVSVSLSLDGKVIFEKKVSVRNPPALCVGVPYLKEYASLCIKFEDLQWTNSSLQGCVFILAQLEGFEVEKIKLGCFKIPPGNSTVKEISLPSDQLSSDQLEAYKPQAVVNQDYNKGDNSDRTLTFQPRKL